MYTINYFITQISDWGCFTNSCQLLIFKTKSLPSFQSWRRTTKYNLGPSYLRYSMDMSRKLTCSMAVWAWWRQEKLPIFKAWENNLYLYRKPKNGRPVHSWHKKCNHDVLWRQTSTVSIFKVEERMLASTSSSTKLYGVTYQQIVIMTHHRILTF